MTEQNNTRNDKVVVKGVVSLYERGDEARGPEILYRDGKGPSDDALLEVRNLYADAGVAA